MKKLEKLKKQHGGIIRNSNYNIIGPFNSTNKQNDPDDGKSTTQYHTTRTVNYYTQNGVPEESSDLVISHDEKSNLPSTDYD